MAEQIYVATLRAVFGADSEVDAIMIADQIKVNGEKDLENSDSLDVTQVTQNLALLAPEEVLSQLRKARNILVRTRVPSGYDLARELDKFIYMLGRRSEGDTGFELAGYDYGHFMEVAKDVLDGGNPIH
jgi:hypothetical protein